MSITGDLGRERLNNSGSAPMVGLTADECMCVCVFISSSNGINIQQQRQNQAVYRQQRQQEAEERGRGEGPPRNRPEVVSNAPGLAVCVSPRRAAARTVNPLVHTFAGQALPLN